MRRNPLSNRGKSGRATRSTVIGLPSDGAGKVTTSRRYEPMLFSFLFVLVYLCQVEAVLEDFERRVASSEDKGAVSSLHTSFQQIYLRLPKVEEQRRYLGGDRDHSILVKGLDFALLQQNKARAAHSADDDESLEQAFQQVSAESTVPKKRTREDIIKELKQKKQKGAALDGVAKDEAVLLEDAKKAGKFKPIGFKPIETSAEGKTKKKKGRDGEKDGNRKKRKIEGGTAEAHKAQTEMPPPALPAKVLPSVPAESEPIPDDFDIFAGAGEYQGIDLGDDDDEEERPTKEDPVVDSPEEPPTILQRGWFTTEDENPPQPQIAQPTSISRSPPPTVSDDEPEQPTRLVPLQSSAIPSIKDLLAMDGAEDKRKMRKNKRKGGKDVNAEEKKKVTAEAKADRDYRRSVFLPFEEWDVTYFLHRLKSYTDKKAGASSSTV